MNKVAWVRYFPDQALLRTAGLTLRAELAHRRLIDLTWSAGRFPTVTPAFARTQLRCLPRAWPAVLEELLANGWTRRRGTLWHSGAASALAEAQRSVADSSRAGRRAAEARWSRSKPPVSTGAPGTSIAPSCTPHADRIPSACGPYADKSKSQKSKEEVPEDNTNALTVERSAAPPLPPCQDAGAEKLFLGEVHGAMTLVSKRCARSEMDNWGGWWRNRYRENPDKARRVLAEIAGMIRERRIKGRPGAAATDLWARLP